MITGTHNQASEEAPRRLVRGWSVFNDLSRSKNSRRKTHTHRATRSRSSNRRGTWRRLVSFRSEDAKLECLAKAECKERVYLRREWRGLGPWPRGPSVSMPRGPVIVSATWKTCITARVDWRQCSQSGGFYWRRVGWSPSTRLIPK
jgi:hypothetical protein